MVPIISPLDNRKSFLAGVLPWHYVTLQSCSSDQATLPTTFLYPHPTAEFLYPGYTFESLEGFRKY